MVIKQYCQNKFSRNQPRKFSICRPSDALSAQVRHHSILSLKTTGWGAFLALVERGPFVLLQAVTWFLRSGLLVSSPVALRATEPTLKPRLGHVPTLWACSGSVSLLLVCPLTSSTPHSPVTAAAPQHSGTQAIPKASWPPNAASPDYTNFPLGYARPQI